MEADWSVEIGPGLPCIDGSWEGFIDLRAAAKAVDTIHESMEHPALRSALLVLNAANSPVFTTKCDIWALAEADIDPYEFGATDDQARAGFASYIDILERDAARFASFTFHEKRIRNLTAHVRELDLRQGRMDLVLRAATMKEQSGYGLSLYAAGCGADSASAYESWKQVLAAAAAAATITRATQLQRTGE
jgi:hypothetical protein